MAYTDRSQWRRNLWGIFGIKIASKSLSCTNSRHFSPCKTETAPWYYGALWKAQYAITRSHTTSLRVQPQNQMCKWCYSERCYFFRYMYFNICNPILVIPCCLSQKRPKSGWDRSAAADSVAPSESAAERRLRRGSLHGPVRPTDDRRKTRLDRDASDSKNLKIIQMKIK